MEQYLPSRFGWLFAAVTVLAAANLMAAWNLSDIAARAETVQSDFLACMALKDQIRALQADLPSEALADKDAEADVAPIRLVLEEAGIAEQHIASIAFRGRVPIPNSNYERLETSLSLREVNLPRLLAFVNEYERSAGGAVCSAIDFTSAPSPQGETVELWNADLTLTRVARAAAKPR